MLVFISSRDSSHRPGPANTTARNLIQGHKQVALESFFRQFVQEVAAFVSDCYAECQTLGVDSESD